MEKIITCVYCGMAYPSGTPAHGSDVSVLTDHIKVCEKHPMRESEVKITTLRKALSGLIGVSSRKDLELMEAFLRTFPGIEADRIAAIDAIHALLETE